MDYIGIGTVKQLSTDSCIIDLSESYDNVIDAKTIYYPNYSSNGDLLESFFIGSGIYKFYDIGVGKDTFTNIQSSIINYDFYDTRLPESIRLQADPNQINKYVMVNVDGNTLYMATPQDSYGDVANIDLKIVDTISNVSGMTNYTLPQEYMDYQISIMSPIEEFSDFNVYDNSNIFFEAINTTDQYLVIATKKIV